MCENSQLQEKKNKGNKPVGKPKGNVSEVTKPDSEALVSAKAAYEKALKAIETAKLAVTMAEVKPFELYGNLLSTEPDSIGKNSSRPK